MVIITAVILLLAILLAPILLIRFRKRWVAAFNLAVTNRITSRFADRLPGFGILTHVGRKSGRAYRTPVNRRDLKAPEPFAPKITRSVVSYRISARAMAFLIVDSPLWLHPLNSARMIPSLLSTK